MMCLEICLVKESVHVLVRENAPGNLIAYILQYTHVSVCAFSGGVGEKESVSVCGFTHVNHCTGHCFYCTSTTMTMLNMLHLKGLFHSMYL